jgi:hypothetical protein
LGGGLTHGRNALGADGAALVERFSPPHAGFLRREASASQLALRHQCFKNSLSASEEIRHCVPIFFLKSPDSSVDITSVSDTPSCCATWAGVSIVGAPATAPLGRAVDRLLAESIARRENPPSSSGCHAETHRDLCR